MGSINRQRGRTSDAAGGTRSYRKVHAPPETPDAPGTATGAIRRQISRVPIPVPYVLALIAILVALAIHYHDMAHNGFVVADDIEADLRAGTARREGPSFFVQSALRFGEYEGRVGALSAYTWGVLPYFFPPNSRALLITSVHTAAFLAIAATVLTYSGLAPAAMTMLALMTLLPIAGGHFPVSAYPIEFHIPLILFFGAMGVHKRMRCL